MTKRIGSALIALAFAFGIIAALGIRAEAQWSTNDDGRYRRNSGYGNQQQLNQGYQYGVQTGASDAQRGQNYGPQRSRYYRGASSQAFREGFVRGYDQGYRQYANNGGYRNDGYGNNGGYRNDGYGNNGGYRNDGYYGNGNGGYDNQELNRGYQQGINTGASDGRSRKSYSPQRSRHYQNASNQAYREGFVRGYDQGYRQYAGSSGNRTGGWGTILGQVLGRP